MHTRNNNQTKEIEKSCLTEDTEVRYTRTASVRFQSNEKNFR